MRYIGSTIYDSPQNKSPVCSMPYTADKENNHYIKVRPYLTSSAAAKWNIHISGKESGQGHMPSVPEIYNRYRLIGGIEIHRQFYIEHITNTICHITITAEIKINL